MPDLSRPDAAATPPETRCGVRRPAGLPRRRRAAVVAALAVALVAAAQPAAAPAATEAQAREAAARGAQWLRTRQAADGSGLAGFALTSLAAGGIHPADVRVGDGPSAAEWQLERWAASGTGPRATDVARSVLAAHASGIDPARVTPQLNLVARLAAYWDGTKLLDAGASGSLSDDIFGLLALSAAGAPQSLLDGVAARIRSQQTAAGGWSFIDGATSPSLDMTGAALAALCTAGRRTPDPQVDTALAYVRASQDPATGGFGGNSDTAGWVVSGLRACAEDPVGPAWRPAERDALDFLLSQQLPSGGFKWVPGDMTENTLATMDAIRPLGGWAFTADPPAREDGGPRQLPSPEVAAGALVPMTLVVDFGPGVPVGNPGRVRACAAQAPAGGTLIELLDAADGCVTEYEAAGGRLLRLEGVAEDPAAGRVWSAAIGGGPADVELDRAIPFGGQVELRFGAPPGGGDVTPPVVTLDASARVRERALDLRIGAHDETTPLSRLRVRVRVDGAPGGFEAHAPVRAVVLPDRDGEHEVCVDAIDEAQNLSAPVCARVVLDRAAPGAPAPAPAGTPPSGAPPAVEARAGLVRITGVRVRRGRLRITGTAVPALNGPAVVRVIAGRVAGGRCRPLGRGRRRACDRLHARTATGVRTWRISLRYRAVRRARLHVAATIRQAGAPDSTVVRRARPRR
jgi:Prenyltransferase and squalene oxidase repeat